MDHERAEFSPRFPQKDKFAREKIFLAELGAERGIKVVPGKAWAYHYPQGAEARSNSLSGLLNGQTKPEDAARVLKPDAFTYDISDLEQVGNQPVIGRVRDAAAYITHYDYPRFARFVSEMQGTGITADTAQSLYDGIAQSRIRKIMIDSYGYTGKEQMKDALRIEAENTAQNIGNLSKAENVLAALKMDWFAEDLQIARTEQRDKSLEQLTQDELELYDKLRDPYQSYVRRGDQTAFDSLVSGVKEYIPGIQKEPIQAERSAEQEQLEKDLENYIRENEQPSPMPELSNQVRERYPASNESTGEFKEGEGRILAEISPAGSSKYPLTDYYATTILSDFDIDSKAWVPDRQLNPYSKSLQGEERQVYQATVSAGTNHIDIPQTYGLDLPTLRYSGAKPEIFQDQNGCFYLKTDGKTQYSVEFLKDSDPQSTPPTAKDLKSLYRESLSSRLEQKIQDAAHSPLDNIGRAEILRSDLFSNHFYPGDGDPKMAEALQRKLDAESTADNFISNLEQSEYLECKSANTLFVASLRKAGIPARLVMGHHIKSAKDGKAVIDSSTGHAWSLVWDGKEWRRMDATPKPRHQKKDQGNDQSSPSQKAQDGGIEPPPDKAQDKQGQDEAKEEKGQKGQGGQPGESKSGQQMGDATDQEIAQGESQLENAKQFSQQMERQKKNIDQKLEKTNSFRDLEKLKEEAENSELFEDMKKDIDKKTEAKKEQMKDTIKEKLGDMADDGFLDDERKDELEKQLEDRKLDELDQLRQEVERESRLHNEYLEIKDEVMPSVDRWYEYFAERLPREEEVEPDEDSLTRQGAFNRHAAMKYRNLVYGTVKNPRIIKPSIKPKFLAAIVLDVSGSMKGQKLKMARKQLIFYNELFSRISSRFGYLRYANYSFSDNVTKLKGYEQDYESPERFDWGDGTRSTVKARIMQQMHAEGGTNMLQVLKEASEDLNRETFKFPNYASSLYYMGDGEDTCNNAGNIKRFLNLSESEQGFGDHMLSAIMMGNETQRKALAGIFGEDHTTVAPDFDTLIEESMYKFDGDIGAYFAGKT